MKTILSRLPVRILAVVLTFTFVAAGADQAGTRVSLQTATARKAAPDFDLPDSSGKRMTLKDYRGKILLLDFWATWCHGCKEEIPWFSAFHEKYSGKGLSVVGVSLDADGWKVVKPFLQATHVPYRIVLGDDAVAKDYGTGSMPDTYLIDRDGKIAAAYSGMVDRNDIESNIQNLLAQP